MGKQKQQVISRFFAVKPKTSSPSSSSILDLSPSPSFPTFSSSPPPKISATVTFSPSKRLRSSQLISSHPKKLKLPKLSPRTHDSISPQSNPSLHKKFLEKLLEPTSCLSETLSGSPKALPGTSVRYTPLEQQVVELKNKYPDVLLMIEVGYKYRFFGEDAAIAARVLGIYAHMDHNFMTASIPTFRLNVHVRRLVIAGYKVGVVKQTETAAIKAHGSNKLGPFCRGLSALYTKATLEAAEYLGGGEDGFGRENNYLACVVEKKIVVETSDCGVESGFNVKIGLVAVEVSTGDVIYGDFNDNFMRSGLEAMILSLSPAEILLGEPLSEQTQKLLLAYAGPASNVRVERATRDCFSNGGALAEVISLFENIDGDKLTDHQQADEKSERQSHHMTIEGIMNLPDLVVLALALTIRHLKQFGFEKALGLGASFRPFSNKIEMILSANAIQQLEILENTADGSEAGSLLRSMNNTLTIFGSRLLRHWVTHPLCDREMIFSRLDAVSEIAESMTPSKRSKNGQRQNGEEVNHLLSSVLTYLGRGPDVQRGITRIFHRTATPSEFIAVLQSILHSGKQLQELLTEDSDGDDSLRTSKVRSKLLNKLILAASSPTIVGNAAKFLSTLNKDAADKSDLPNLIITNNGQFPEVSMAKKEVQHAEDKLDCLISLYRKSLRMQSLEFTSVSETTHLIEVLNKQESLFEYFSLPWILLHLLKESFPWQLPLDVKVPANWVKVNSTKKTVRYHPPEVLTALDQLSLANERHMLSCRAAWDGFLSNFSRYYTEFRVAVEALATLDCLHSLAILSRNKDYVRPKFVCNDEPAQIYIRSGRHPVLEAALQDNFVPNDTNLHADREHCQIVTGPNMGGKSCYIRQVALIAIMAQIGSFVPAASAKLHVLDGIHTRMGSSDSIQQGRSTFLEELGEASHILHNSTAKSLVIIDELGRGTSTHDGVAIAYATLHYLLKEKKCLVLFITHYPKIADIRNEFLGSVQAYHVSFLTSREDSRLLDEYDYEDVTYLYKLVHGVSDRSFGFKVAQLAQIPLSCIARATNMGAYLEAAVNKRTASENRLKTSVCDRDEEADRLEEDSNNLSLVYEKFFSILKDGLMMDDVAQSFELFKQAKSIAVNFLTGKSEVLS